MKPDVVRKRAPGEGRKATLRTSRDKLFYMLLYCKCYSTFDLMSVLFGFDRSCAWDWVHGLFPVLEQTLTLGHKQDFRAQTGATGAQGAEQGIKQTTEEEEEPRV